MVTLNENHLSSLSFTTRRREVLLLGSAFTAFILVSYYLIPNFIIFRSDDFGYYESLVKSLQQGKILRSEWLEPLNIGLTSTSFILFKVTGNFYLSTIGLVAILSVFNFTLIIKLLKPLFSLETAVILSFLFCTFPVYINKSTEFSGTIFSFCIFLISLILYQKNRTVLFYLIVLIGFSNRQNAVILLGLPFYDFLSSLLQHKKIRWDLAAYTIIFFVGAFLLSNTQNVTYAQYHITNNLFRNFDIVVSLNTFLRVFTIILISTFIIQFFFDSNGLRYISKNIRKFYFPLIATILVIASFLLSNGNLFTFNGPGLGSISAKFQFNKLFYLLAIVASLALNYKVFLGAIKSSPYFTVILFQALLLSIKGTLWDYYFLEIQVLLLLVFFNGKEAEISVRKILLGSVLVLNLLYIYLFKVYSDAVEMKTFVYEKLLRENRIEVNQLRNSPWAFSGWKLYNYFIENEGKNEFTALSRFLCYLDDPSVVTKIDYPRIAFISNMINKGVTSNHTDVLTYGQTNIGGVFCRYQVLKNNKQERFNPCENEGLDFRLKVSFPSRTMPLNNQEWSELINSN